MTDPVAACLDGRLTPEIAIARLLLRGEDPPAILAQVLAARRPGPPWRALHALAIDAPALVRLRRMIQAAGVEHAAPATPEAIAAMFDRAVAVSPEASVALYSLGDPARLAAATDEIVAWLRETGLLGVGADVLDLGCGIGRVAAAVSPHVGTVHGIDTSAGMVREARRRCAGLTNVQISASDGRGLSAVETASLDLILAVDSVPYLVQAGVAEQHMEDARRVLKPSGAVVVLNLSYEDDAGRSLARDWAGRFGFMLKALSASPFRHWDGLPFIFRRAFSDGHFQTGMFKLAFSGRANRRHG